MEGDPSQTPCLDSEETTINTQIRQCIDSQHSQSSFKRQKCEHTTPDSSQSSQQNAQQWWDYPSSDDDGDDDDSIKDTNDMLVNDDGDDDDSIKDMLVNDDGDDDDNIKNINDMLVNGIQGRPGWNEATTALVLGQFQRGKTMKLSMFSKVVKPELYCPFTNLLVAMYEEGYISLEDDPIWDHGRPCGNGTFTFPDENTWFGDWLYGRPYGKGTLTNPDGETVLICTNETMFRMQLTVSDYLGQYELSDDHAGVEACTAR